MIENLEHINTSGMRDFIENKHVRWTCPECGGTFFVHRGYCYFCSAKKLLLRLQGDITWLDQ